MFGHDRDYEVVCQRSAARGREARERELRVVVVNSLVGATGCASGSSADRPDYKRLRWIALDVAL